MRRLFFSMLVPLFLVPRPLPAQEKGSITGRVYDARTGKGLPGASVYIPGTSHGAPTDLEGHYTITGLPPGTYEVTASMLGYKDLTQKVTVPPGKQVFLDFYLEEEIITLEKVEVVGERPLLEKELSASLRVAEREEIQELPVESARDIVVQKAGVTGQGTDIHIRGGRTSEILVLVDGIPIRDPLSGSAFGMSIPRSAIKEFAALTGGFNAEYGEATSGVINISLREGSRTFHGGLELRTGTFGTVFPDTTAPIFGYYGWDNLDLTFEGPLKFLPLPGERTFFLNLFGSTNSTYLPHADRLFSSVIGTDRLFPRTENRLTALIKLAWKPDENRKLIFSATKSLEVNRGYFYHRSDYPFAYGFPFRYLYHLEGYPTFTRDGNYAYLAWHHVLSATTVYDLKLSRFFTNLHLDVNGKHWSEYEELGDLLPPPQDSTDLPGDGYFYDTGDAPYWHDHYVETFGLKFDLTRQLSPVHMGKTGFLLEYSNFQWIDIQYPWFYDPAGLGLNHDLYRAYTTRGGIYAQDQIQFAGMIANVGLRFDFWVPGDYVDRSVKRLLETSAGELSPVVEREYRTYLEETPSLLGRRIKGHLSPRVGIAYPITDRDKFYFSYGHFAQIPDYKYVYSKLGRRATAGYELTGNPNLRPIITVAYEMGYEHLFREDLKLNVTAYYKDIFNYPTAIRVPGIPPNPDFWMYFNSDYARSMGIEVELRKRYTRFLYGSLEFTLSQAKGKASSAEDLYWGVTEESLREWHLRWDRPYKLFAYLGFRAKKGQHPLLLGRRLPDRWTLTVAASFQAGRRYTPMDSLGNPGELNSALGPPWSRVDLTFRKAFSLLKGTIEFYLEVRNLFDHKNLYYVNPITGRDYRPGDPIPPRWRVFYLKNPARYRDPRSLRAGLVFRW